VKPEQVQALLLRLTPYGESDAIVQLLTAETGIVSALARGARKSRRRFGGALDYFCLLSAELRAARSGLGKLLEVELLQSFDRVRGQMDCYLLGCHFLEVARLGGREACPAPELFHLTQSALAALDAGAHPGSLARVFQTRALSVLGYGLSLDACPSCTADLAAGGSAIHTERGISGGVVCLSCAPAESRTLSPGAFQTLRAALRLPLERLGTLRVTPAVSGELEGPLEGLLSAALGLRPHSLDALREGSRVGSFPLEEKPC
jgi:DNA repair protein RecO (recombination protein O)